MNDTDLRKLLWALLAGFAIGIVGTVAVQSSCNGPVVPDVPEVIPDQPGPREVFLVHESADDSPALAQVILDLRTGEAQKYLVDHGHLLDILDDDSEDENKKPSPLVESLKPALANVTMPAIVIRDAKSHKVLLAEPLGSRSAADVIAVLKANGG